MTGDPYIPDLGPAVRFRRLAARHFARQPMAIRTERPLVSFTFDDFPRSAATVGKNALEARGWRGTYFASGDQAGRTTHLGRMFEAEDLRRLERDGHEIACHSFSHLDAGRASIEAIRADIERNAAALADMGCAVRQTTFAYPYGEASVGAKRMLAARFRALRGVRAGINRDGADRALLKAVAIDGGEAGVARAVAFAEEAALRPGWLIYFTHDVRPDPSPWGCTPQQLACVLAAAAASGAEVVPVREALDRLDTRG